MYPKGTSRVLDYALEKKGGEIHESGAKKVWSRGILPGQSHVSSETIIDTVRACNFIGNKAPSRFQLGDDLEEPQVSGRTERRRISPTSKSKSVTGPHAEFNPLFTFERFVIGPENQLACYAAERFARRAGGQFEIVFIHGGTGLGKTHLVHAVAQSMVQSSPGRNCTYLNGDRYVERLKLGDAFDAMYGHDADLLGAEVLFLEDIQAFNSDVDAQVALLQVFEVFCNQNKKVFLTCDRSLKDLGGLIPRLKSRLEAGLVVEIAMPDIKTRVAILEASARESRQAVPCEVLHRIAMQEISTIWELQGILKNLLSICELLDREPCNSLVERVIRNRSCSVAGSKVTVDCIKAAVASHFQVEILELAGCSRQRQFAFPRQIAMRLCKDLIPSITLSEIGQAFGDRDAATVHHACDQVEMKARSDAHLSEQLRVLSMFARKIAATAL